MREIMLRNHKSSCSVSDRTFFNLFIQLNRLVSNCAVTKEQSRGSGE